MTSMTFKLLGRWLDQAWRSGAVFGATALALALLLLLGACGGGDGPSSAKRASSAAGTASLADGGPDSLAPTGATALPQARKQALSHAWFNDVLISSFAFFDEVQAAYPQHFGNLGPTQTFGPYTYRYDASTRNYLALTDTDIVLMGPVVGSLNTPVTYAPLAGFCGAPATARFCGYVERKTLMVAGLEREYIVYRPWKARHADKLPVVFMLHGTSGTGAEFFDRSGWREQADAEGFIAVFPTALRHCFYEDDITVNGIFDADERRTPTKWAAGHLGDPTKMPLCTAAQIAQLPADLQAKVDHPLADDIAFVDAMVSDLRTNFAADPKRLYVSGFSNGGQMSGRLAAERSTVFASLAAAAGPAYTPLPLAARPLSFVFTVGELDDRFTAPFGGAPLPLTDSGGAEVFKNVLVRPHANPQQLSDTSYAFSATTLYQTPVALYTYASSTALPAQTNRLYVGVIAGLFHQYPNGDNHPVKMAELLWGFFKTQALP